MFNVRYGTVYTARSGMCAREQVNVTGCSDLGVFLKEPDIKSHWISTHQQFKNRILRNFTVFKTESHLLQYSCFLVDALRVFRSQVSYSWCLKCLMREDGYFTYDKRGLDYQYLSMKLYFVCYSCFVFGSIIWFHIKEYFVMFYLRP